MDKKKKTKILIASLAGAVLLCGIGIGIPIIKTANLTNDSLTFEDGKYPAMDPGVGEPKPSEGGVDMDDATAVGSELKNAQALFPDVKAVGKWSKEDVQLAAYAASDYLNTAYDSAYFISGRWQKDGYPESKLENIRLAYTDKAWEEVKPDIALLKTTPMTEESKAEIIRFTNNVLFTDLRGQEDVYSAYSFCATSEYNSCLKDGKINIINQEIYEGTEADGLVYVAEFEAPAYYDLAEGGVGMVTYKYKTEMVMVKGQPSTAQNIKTFRIGGGKTEWTHDGFKKVEIVKDEN